MTIAKPTQVATPFANSGLKNSIPQSATGSNLASLEEGFPAVTMTAVADGGTPPQGQDFNGILNQVTSQLRYAQAGGLYPYDSTFCTAIGGYPLGAVLMSADGSKLWQNQVAGNTNNPDSDDTNWTELCTVDALTAGLATKQGTLTFDSTPIADSSNPVTSDGIADALDGKLDTSGGTLTGNLFFPLGFINNDDVNNYFAFWSGSGFTGAAISLGTQEATYAGAVIIQPANSVGGRASITRFENTGAITYANSEANISRTAFSVLDAPCDSNTTLSLPASGGTINAPDDGYLSLLINSTASGQFVRMDGDSTNVRQSCYATAASQNLCVTIRVKKGDAVTVRYTAAGTTQWFRFTKTVCADMM